MPWLCLGALPILALLSGPLSAAEVTIANDPFSRRIEKRVDGARVKAWLWNDALRPAAELDAANKVTATFIYAGGVNVPSHAIKGADTFRLITDARGSVRLVVNTQTGAIAQRLDYDEFGRVTSDTSPGFQPFGFAGGLYDPDTGLIRFGARDYDAQMARWTDKDPIGFAGRQPNLYAYAGNDPVNVTDATGTEGGSLGSGIGVLSGQGTLAGNVTGTVSNPGTVAAGGSLGGGVGVLSGDGNVAQNATGTVAVGGGIGVLSGPLGQNAVGNVTGDDSGSISGGIAILSGPLGQNATGTVTDESGGLSGGIAILRGEQSRDVPGGVCPVPRRGPRGGAGGPGPIGARQIVPPVAEGGGLAGGIAI